MNVMEYYDNMISKEVIKKYLLDEMYMLIKLRNKANKVWNTSDFLYYQGKIDLIEQLMNHWELKK